METLVKHEDIVKVAEQIGRQFKPEKIILFGSYAWGSPNADSDVDLFIIKDTDNTRLQAIKISSSVYPRPFPMDLMVYTPEQVNTLHGGHDYLLNDILANGKIIYG